MSKASLKGKQFDVFKGVGEITGFGHTDELNCSCFPSSPQKTG